MYKVLVVDDEQLNLEGLKKLIAWDRLGMSVMAGLNSGFSALEWMRENAVDILVTDIKMPIMTGLELARKAVETYPKLKVVFISGYEDFHYAKQAIAVNASGYVLKPVAEKELFGVLQGVRDDLDKERQREHLESVYKESIPYFKNEWMHQWLEGTAEGPNLTEEYALKFLGSPCSVAIVEIDDLKWKLNHFPEEQRAGIVQKVFDLITEKCGQEDMELLCKIGRHRVALVAHQADAGPGLERLVAYVGSRSPLSVTIGLGAAGSTAEDVRLSYRQAREALGYKMFYGKNRLIRGSDHKEEAAREARDLNEILESLFAAMTQYRLVQIDDNIIDLFILVANLKTKLSIYHFALHIISRLDGYLNTLNENLYSLLGLESKNLDILFHFETLDDIQSWLRKRLFEISELLHMKKKHKNRKLVEEMEKYVQERLDRNIVLRDAANYFSFTPNYLGYLFKEETGQNFSDFVIKKRFEKARELLKDPKMKIYEAAYRVGYKNLTYFSRQFKETYGMTPGEFRKQS